jgi:putative addiction module component (TIGR02574 family)
LLNNLFEGILIGVMSELLEKALELPIAERIRLADKLYMSVGDLPGTTPLTDAQIAELERRLEEHRLNPDAGIPLEDFLERFNAR